MRNALVFRAAICIIGGISLLGYIGLYAQVTMYGYSRADLSRQIRQAEMENQALKAEIQTLSSPDRLAAAAQGAGMEPGVQVVYVHRPVNVKIARAE
jgi:cell division protein FtsL